MLSLNNPQDLLNKCKYDVERIKMSATHPEYDYAIFDAVLSLNHLFEWCLKDKETSAQEKIRCIEIFNPFLTPYDVSSDFKRLYKKLSNFPNVNYAQLNIRLLCNKAKHFKQNAPIEKKEKNILSVAGNMFADSSTAIAGYYERYRYSIEIDGVDVDLQEIMYGLWLNWVEFLE